MNMGIEKLATKLKARAEYLRIEIAKADASTREPSVGGDEADQAQAINEAAERNAFRDRFKAELNRITVALARIQAGLYGTCGGCGGCIGDKRLAVNPATSFCFDCQSQAEAEAKSKQ
jgi:DnaK suppressor protein